MTIDKHSIYETLIFVNWTSVPMGFNKVEIGEVKVKLCVKLEVLQMCHIAYDIEVVAVVMLIKVHTD